MSNIIKIKITPKLYLELNTDSFEITPSKKLTPEERHKVDIGIQVLKDYQDHPLTSDLIHKIESKIVQTISMEKWYNRKC